MFVEPADGGTEVVLKIRLSSNGEDVKLPVLSTDTVATAKKKLQVIVGVIIFRARFNTHHPNALLIFLFSVRRDWNPLDKDGSLVESCSVTSCE